MSLVRFDSALASEWRRWAAEFGGPVSSVGWLVLQIIVAISVMVMTGSVLVEIAFGINCWRVLEASRLKGDARADEPNLHQRPARRVPAAAGHAHALTHSPKHVP